jgi:hypothetical protein
VTIPIIERIVSKFNLPCSRLSNKESVCDTCQRAKGHQLPYSKSNSSLSHPLELIYSNVWDYAPKSVGNKQYYVSFIDDYSNFSWIYPLKFKSEVFSKFVEFQKLVEHLFDRKIITIHIDLEANTRSSMDSSPKSALATMSPAPTPTNKRVQ